MLQLSGMRAGKEAKGEGRRGMEWIIERGGGMVVGGAMGVVEGVLICNGDGTELQQQGERGCMSSP